MHSPSVALSVLLMGLALPATAQKTHNLLSRPDIVFLEQQSAGLDLSETLLIKDEQLDTQSAINISDTNAVELVFSLTQGTVTPTALRLQTDSLKNDTAYIEVLVSEDGPDTGYLSLRTEPLKELNGWQQFTFEPAAAKWLMIKFNAFNGETQFDLKELEIEGYDGAPMSLYAFDESPADALDVLKGLENSGLSFDIHTDEKSLFEDAADGTLDSWSFAEASLLSSGVYDYAQRKDYLTRIETLTEEARTIVNSEDNKFAQGRLLLEWLHKGIMKNGYVEAQTDMASVLAENHYNCVSSSTLYNIIARELGLDARGIEVPDHAFSILYDGTDHVDVETTTPQGFDPARDRAALNAFSRTTGYTYINDKHRAKRRELNDFGVVALTYYNHGVTATNDGDYPLALLNYFRALSLDPRSKSAVKNTLSVLGKWSNESIEQGNPNRAIEILDVALSFAPNDRTMRHNMRYALQESMLASSTPEEQQTLNTIATEMHKRTDDNTFLRLQTQVLQSKAYDIADTGDYEGALKLTETVTDYNDDATQGSIERFRVSLFLNWSNDALDAKNYALAVDVLERALAEPRKDHRVKNNITYAAQEWGASVATTEGTEASQTLLRELSERFPDIKGLNRLAAQNYEEDARTAFDAGDFETAINVYQAAQKLGIGGNIMEQNEKAAWNNWGIAMVDQGNFSGALAIFERARSFHPGYSNFNNNIAFIVQEWGKSINQKNGITEAEKTVALQRTRFDNISQLKQIQGIFINQAVNNATTAEEFQSLEATLKQVGDYAAQQSRHDKLVAYYYQQWAKTAHPDFEDDLSVVILQSGVDKHSNNRDVKKMFVYAVNNLGEKAQRDGDLPRALSIFQSATRSLPDERSFAKQIENLKKQQ